VPQWFLRERIGGHWFDSRVRIVSFQVDVGVLQDVCSVSKGVDKNIIDDDGHMMNKKKELVVDMEKTVSALERFWLDEKERTNRVNHMVNELRSQFDGCCRRVSGIIYDITPLAPLVAREMGVPSVAVSNFAWNWLYSDWLTHCISGDSNCEYFEGQSLSSEKMNSLQQVIQLQTDAYASTNMFIRLPYCARGIPGLSDPGVLQVDLDSWLSGVHVSQASSANKHVDDNDGSALLLERKKQKILQAMFPDEIIDRDCNLMLFSFGGGKELQQTLVDDKYIEQWWSHQSLPKNWKVIINLQYEGKHPTLLFLSHDALTSNNISMIDVMSVVDVICCKTGYGIVSEILALTAQRNSSASMLKGVLYTDRPGFCEHFLLESALLDSLGPNRCKYVQMTSDVLQASEYLFQSAQEIVNYHNESPSNHNQTFNGGEKAAKTIMDFINGQ